MKLTIGHLYPDLLNLYGDRGNIQCLMKRCNGEESRRKPLSLNWGMPLTFQIWILCS